MREQLVRIPKSDWPLFKKCAKNRGYPDARGTKAAGEMIFMSGAPLHIAADILSGIQSGEIKPSLLPIAFQEMWVGANKKECWTVWCPKYGKICGAHKVCTEHRRAKGSRGYTIIRPECQYYVEVKIEGIVCLHPKAEEFELRSPWKEEQTMENMPLFPGPPISEKICEGVELRRIVIDPSYGPKAMGQLSRLKQSGREKSKPSS